MEKQTNINRYYILVIIFFLILPPIFISYNSINDFSFNEISKIGTSENYKFTLPISFFFIVPFILLGLVNFYKDFEISSLLVLILLSFAGASLDKDFTNLSLLLKISCSILTLLGFEIFFMFSLRLKNKIIFFPI